MSGCGCFTLRSFAPFAVKRTARFRPHHSAGERRVYLWEGKQVDIARWLHVTGVVVWVGGMFFAYMALRPAAAKLLEPAQRLPLWSATFTNFFPWVWVAVWLILPSGAYLFVLMGGFAGAPRHANIMFALGLVMIWIFGHVYYSSFRKLKRHVALKDWPQAGAALNQIRVLVGANLLLGLLTIAVATAGRLL